MTSYPAQLRPRSTLRYTATPPTEPGWWRIRKDPVSKLGMGYYRFSVVEVATSGKDKSLVVWVDEKSAWVPVTTLDALWGARVDF